jgi:hypothetical protein
LLRRRSKAVFKQFKAVRRAGYWHQPFAEPPSVSLRPSKHNVILSYNAIMGCTTSRCGLLSSHQPMQRLSGTLLIDFMPIGLTPKNTKCGAPNVLGQEEYPVAKYSITIFETMTYGRFNLQRGDADMRKPPRRMKSIS